MTPLTPPFVYKARFVELAALLAIFLLAAHLRLANLGHNPGWYADKGNHLNIAQKSVGLLYWVVRSMQVGKNQLVPKTICRTWSNESV
jgi:hypothetical protein